jgi:FkbH-like protein
MQNSTKLQDLKYTEILATNKLLGEKLSYQVPQEAVVLSNIITSQVNHIIEYVLRNRGLYVKLNSGDYDNIVQDSEKYAHQKVIIIFWELANLIDGLQYKAETMSAESIEDLMNKTKQEIDLVFQNLANTPIVIFNQFSTVAFNQYFLKNNQFDNIAIELNKYVSDNLPKNFIVVPMDKIFAQISVAKSIDLRYYYSSKALYSIDFYKQYAQFIAPIILSVYGKTKKALIFDCDNTLWKGIVGEDGVAGILLSSQDKNGTVFEEVHYLSNQLAQEGIIIGLCSKNNEEDVLEVFEKRQDFALLQNTILIKKINWQDKVTNLQEIATELNIGIDSLVFVDDSYFEINHVQNSLPEVHTIQVPTTLPMYGALLKENLSLFYKHSQTKEDKKRIEMYKQEAIRKGEQQKFATIEEYLHSLELEISITINDFDNLERAAQLTQKTNQFNLTTKRYTQTDLQNLITNQNYRLYTFRVKDKFGDYGLTGMSLISIAGENAIIDTLLMSCRVLGRNIEIAFLGFIINDLQQINIKYIFASYFKTLKNSQVASFYEKLNFEVIREDVDRKEYKFQTIDFSYCPIDYIKIQLF